MAKGFKQKKSFSEKIQDEMPEFADEVAGLNVPDLNARLAAIARAQQENDEKQEEDEELQEARTTASELAKAYTEPKKALKLKTKYIVKLIKEKGGA